jgi:methylglutaconyl-CoA hydratase
MNTQSIQVSISEQIATVTLDRPEKRNALHGPMVSELLQALKELAEDSASRILLVMGNGENFCAGGDIAWMQHMITGPEDTNYDDAQSLADLLYLLYHFPKPTIVLAHGASLGGGMGLIAAADMVVAANNASFGLPEVKMGLAPSMISPYVMAAIGERWARYYFLTGERFGAEAAYRLGLVHQLSGPAALMSTGVSLARSLLANGPHALRSAKRLIHYVAKQEISEGLAQKTAEHLAELRTTPEAQEGLRAFLEKRKPQWEG